LRLCRILLHLLGWLARSVFACNHARTVVNEGKCYCPDCGRGLIYQWVVLRCTACGSRRESGYLLRQVIPRQRCCPHCGDSLWHLDILDSPSYFQLDQARLMVKEEVDYNQQPYLWSLYSFHNALAASLERTVASTFAWLDPEADTASRRVLALLPVEARA
jgi:uncharacterized protein (DUF983 family)